MRVLVVTTVHQADDPRIRERTIRSLVDGFDVRYATRAPGPGDRVDHEWVELRGGRVRRWWGALRRMLAGDVDLVSIHDPELIPAGMIARVLRRRRVVLDVHENVPAVIRQRGWVPRVLRPPIAWAATLLLRLSERMFTITLAEPGYGALFRRDHPVFPNHPAADSLPAPGPDERYVVYVGDVTVARGAADMVEAVAAMESPLPLVVIGRCSPDLRDRLTALAEELGVELETAGFLPHAEAMRRAASATAGLSLLRDLPNARHSLPTKLYEYLGMGVPVVATALPGTVEAVDGLPGAHLVPPGDPAAAAAALDRIAVDPEVRRGTAGAASGLVASRVWPAGEVLAVYRRAAG